ncbi:MAG: hypothetical protein KF819_24815 [Labilithrix sp.]|nr:hypothetical protein [Labilithrix sp.]
MALLVLLSVHLHSIAFGLMMTGSRARRLVVALIGWTALAMPFYVRFEPWLPGITALMLVGVAVRLYDLAMEKEVLPAWRRVLHASVWIEMRRTPRIAPYFHRRSVGALVVFGGLAAAGIELVFSTQVFLLRWIGGALAAYASFSAFCALAMLLWSALGFALPRLHDHPIKSRTIAEFWGERWNRIVGAWLRTSCFMPLARRRMPRLGLVAAFTVSTILHAYLAWAALDARAALYWCVFFMLQIPLVFAERALRVARWPPALGRAWTIGVMFLASYFFVEPEIRFFDSLR